MIMAQHELLDRYGEKLARTGLVEAKNLLLGTDLEAPGGNEPQRSSFPSPSSATDRMAARRPARQGAGLEPRRSLTLPLNKMGVRLGRRAVIAARPAEPYRTMLRHLTAAGKLINPMILKPGSFSPISPSWTPSPRRN